MAKSRDAVRMNEAEVSAFLAEAHSLQVATLGKEGAPHLTTVWFAVHDGVILFETYGKSQKVVNLQRDPRIAVLAEDGRTYDQLRGVSINGTAEVIEDNPERTALMRVLVDHHFPGQAADALDEMAARMAEKRVVIRVKPDKIMSWDHRKLDGKGP
ncbi:PPOX class F420-dependent oxidoreductase [Novosphingobium sp.]|uniref:pyridoxamine 5'-phosphate oxidase family protein n=1 Tax=Novosphingobium sp. TaxID=1874826 RepID=UPI00286DAC49|nr:PPOX class F420-dependent oxidoreductase [Novosphingobium sp.]